MVLNKMEGVRGGGVSSDNNTYDVASNENLEDLSDYALVPVRSTGLKAYCTGLKVYCTVPHRRTISPFNLPTQQQDLSMSPTRQLLASRGRVERRL